MREEFAGWYASLWPRVFRAVALAVGDRELAEEAVAEAFARALARWPQAAEMHAPEAWLYRVAVNQVRTGWRRRRVEQRALQRLAARPEPAVAGPSPRDELLWDAVAALSDRARRMVALRYVLDLPEAEIAELLGVTRGTVASTLSKARKELSAALVRTHATTTLSGKGAS